MKNNVFSHKFRWLYAIGFFIILALPILTFPPYFFPADWGKTIIFRSILAILLFLFAYQYFFRKQELHLPILKKNVLVWLLAALFIIFLLASIFSVDPYFSFWGSPYRSGGFITFAFYFVFAILVFMLFDNGDWENAWLVSIIIGVFVSLIAIIQYYGLLGSLFAPAPYRPPSTMGNPDILATYLLLLSFITLSLGIKEPFHSHSGKTKKIFYFFSLILFLHVMLISGARAVYLGMALGLLYFLLLYPKKMKVIKPIIVGLAILAGGVIFYVSAIDQYPKFLEQSRLFEPIISRLSVKKLISDPRFAAWQIDLHIVKDRLLLGYGPENFSVGFDKYYNPAIPYLNTDISWWDKAHNIIFQTISDAGIFALITYLLFFVALFWQLNKLKNQQKSASESEHQKLLAHGIQATLIGYFIANLFGFDSFATYLIFFLIIGYSLYLTDHSRIKTSVIASRSEAISLNLFDRLLRFARNDGGRKTIFAFLFILLIWFLWQYNLLPFYINGQANKAQDLVNQKNCAAAFALMDMQLQYHSFLDSYTRLEYGDFVKSCNGDYPEYSRAYLKKGVEVISQAIKIQPLYTRYWIFLGNAATILAEQEKNIETKNSLLTEAKNYLNKALQLSPRHQEILVGLAKLQIVAGNYQGAKQYSQECITINSAFPDCWWYLGLSKIYLKDGTDADKTILKSNQKGYDITTEASLLELSNAYGSVSDYQNLVSVYEKLVAKNQNNPQYHSSLAFFYRQTGQYAKARQEALTVLRLSPQSKQNVEAFLQTLPK